MEFGSGGAMQQVSTYLEAMTPTVKRPSSFHCSFLAASSQWLHICEEYRCIMS